MELNWAPQNRWQTEEPDPAEAAPWTAQPPLAPTGGRRGLRARRRSRRVGPIARFPAPRRPTSTFRSIKPDRHSPRTNRKSQRAGTKSNQTAGTKSN